MRLVVPVALTAALGVGCVSNDNSVFVETALSIDSASSCQPDAQGDPLPAGTFDILNPVRGYQAALKVITNLPSTFSNQDVSRGDTQSPNFPDYGPTDNNVLVFQTADVAFSFVAGEDALAAAKDEKFACDDRNVCRAEGGGPQVSGTVFNEGTQLSTEGIVFLEAISAVEAEKFSNALVDVLTTPNARQRITAEITLSATTTGNGDLRPVTSFPFPLAIDLCKGCLVPSAATCAGVRGTRADAATKDDVCFEGQDLASFECVCGGNPCF